MNGQKKKINIVRKLPQWPTKIDRGEKSETCESRGNEKKLYLPSEFMRQQLHNQHSIFFFTFFLGFQFARDDSGIFIVHLRQKIS